MEGGRRVCLPPPPSSSSPPPLTAVLPLFSIQPLLFLLIPQRAACQELLKFCFKIAPFKSTCSSGPARTGSVIDAGQYGIRSESKAWGLVFTRCLRVGPSGSGRPRSLRDLHVPLHRPAGSLKGGTFFFSLLAHVVRVDVLTSAAKSPWSQSRLGFVPAVRTRWLEKKRYQKQFFIKCYICFFLNTHNTDICCLINT